MARTVKCFYVFAGPGPTPLLGTLRSRHRRRGALRGSSPRAPGAQCRGREASRASGRPGGVPALPRRGPRSGAGRLGGERRSERGRPARPGAAAVQPEQAREPRPRVAGREPAVADDVGGLGRDVAPVGRLDAPVAHSGKALGPGRQGEPCGAGGLRPQPHSAQNPTPSGPRYRGGPRCRPRTLPGPQLRMGARTPVP